VRQKRRNSAAAAPPAAAAPTTTAPGGAVGAGARATFVGARSPRAPPAVDAVNVGSSGERAHDKGRNSLDRADRSTAAMPGRPSARASAAGGAVCDSSALALVEPTGGSPEASGAPPETYGLGPAPAGAAVAGLLVPTGVKLCGEAGDVGGLGVEDELGDELENELGIASSGWVGAAVSVTAVAI
jgi:hypothetical protein